MRAFAYPVLLVLLIPFLTQGQVTTAPIEGLRENTPKSHVLREATIWVDSQRKIPNGTIILRNGFVEAVGGPDLPSPADAREWKLPGKIIYPGFVEAASPLGLPNSISNSNTHWNPLVRPERRAAAFSPPEGQDLEKVRNLGFTTLHLVPSKGIFRGQTAVLNLGDSPSIVTADTHQCLAFEQREKNYPVSLMGTVALVRQVLHDTRWYRDQILQLDRIPVLERPEANAALAALAPLTERRQTLIALAEDELDYARILNLATEFHLLKPVLIGNGREYRQLDLLEQAASSVVLPLQFPKAPPVEMPEAVLELSLATLEHWERAPANAASLAGRGIPICLSARGLEKPEDEFWNRIRKCVQHGLSPEQALKALTEEPARLLQLSDRLGTLQPGRIANLVVASGDLFQDSDAVVEATWIDGVVFETPHARRLDPRGTWTGIQGEEPWTVEGSLKAPSLTIDGQSYPFRMEADKVLLFPPARLWEDGLEGTVRLTGFLSEDRRTAEGSGYLPGGESFSWSARIAPPSPDTSAPEEKGSTPVRLSPFTKYPAGAFGRVRPPEQPSLLLVENATLWTCGKDGILPQSDLLIRDGRIVSVGPDLRPSQAESLTVIDASGKHVTPGLIDCHSHSAINRGINEGSHAVTAEVRVADVIDATDIALYRQLAGGLTTASLLHGSANPMGGQNAVIKLRWGSKGADQMLFQGAKPGVKFALGENVKQSNWREPTNRYPQTRMGVEQIMKDTFLAARDYATSRANATSKDLPHRRNLRLEAILEILSRNRIVHIHSYRQDEILMFVRLAQEFHFDVGTFQHVLEGYKVADAIAEIGAGGSSFSDWWAYKFEVYDAIPYNGALLHRAGVVTSFNSDSNELATRLNTEAAKAVKYGGLSQEEALHFVTINPARQLRIEDRVGSLEPGKDADFVIWNAPPLSSYARAEQTWIDGRCYFDLISDGELRQEALRERERLIAAALPQRLKSLETQRAKDELEENSKPEAKRPLPSIFRNRSSQILCRSRETGLYHNGQDTHTCTSMCCGRP